MTALDREPGVSHGEVAVPGEVRRWRAFWLLAVSFLMTVVDLAIVLARAVAASLPRERPVPATTD
jgi:hypothetical protein